MKKSKNKQIQKLYNYILIEVTLFTKSLWNTYLLTIHFGAPCNMYAEFILSEKRDLSII